MIVRSLGEVSDYRRHSDGQLSQVRNDNFGDQLHTERRARDEHRISSWW